MLRKQLRRHRPLPGVAAEQLIHAREAIVREIVEAAARRMRRVHPQQRRLGHVQRSGTVIVFIGRNSIAGEASRSIFAAPLTGV